MSLNGLCIFNSFSKNPNNEYKYQRLKEEFLPYQVNLDKKEALSVLPLCYGDKTVINGLSDYDFVIYLDKDTYLAKAISDKLPLFNSYESLLLSDDKMLSLLQLEKYKIPCPLTIPAPLCYVDEIEKEKKEQFFSTLERNFTYPFVFKENYGSLGKQVKLIHDREELESTYEAYKRVPHLYEKFLSKNQGHDYRVIVIDKKVISVMERINKNDFRSNIALGGIGIDATDTLPQSYKDIAIRASEALKLDYAGIDIGTDDDGNPMFIEANGNAFFTEIEKVTKTNIAKEIVLMILSRMKKRPS